MQRTLQQVFDAHEKIGLKVAFLGMLVMLAYEIYANEQLDWSKTIPRVAFIVLGAIAIDASIHATLTTPFEITGYWAWKLVAGSIVAIWMLNHDLSYPSILLGGLAFAGFISVYYRSLELITGFPIGSHVPAWNLRGKEISFAQNPIVSTLLWGVTHTSAWIIPSIALKKLLS